jgi:hypothetical protein
VAQGWGLAARRDDEDSGEDGDEQLQPQGGVAGGTNGAERTRGGRVAAGRDATGAIGAGGRTGQGSGSESESEALQPRANCSAKESEGQGGSANLTTAHLSANCAMKFGAVLGTAVAISCRPVGRGVRVGMPGRTGPAGREGGGGGGRDVVETMGDDGRGGGCIAAGGWVSGSTVKGVLPSLSSRSCCILASCVPFGYAGHRQSSTGSSLRCIRR